MRLRSFVAVLVGAAAVFVSSLSPAVAAPPQEAFCLQAHRIADLLEAIPGDGATEKDLTELLTTLVAPRSWDNRGGAGTIYYSPLTKAFVVNQTPAVHEQIEEFFTTLRRLAVSEQELNLNELRTAATKATKPAEQVVFATPAPTPFAFPIQAASRALPLAAAPSIIPVAAFEKEEIPAAPANDIQVALEIKFVSIPQAFFERVGVDFEANQNGPGNQTIKQVGYAAPFEKVFQQNFAKKNGVAFLNDAQVFTLLEAAQGDIRTTIMQAPKVTLLNGQSATMYSFSTDDGNFVGFRDVKSTTSDLATKLPPNATGFFISAKPVVSADRRTVRLELCVEQSQKECDTTTCCETKDSCPLCCVKPAMSTKKVNTTIAVPDGGTVMLGGLKKTVEKRSEYGPPIMSRVPYVSRMFKNVGIARETHDVLVLVTPRVLVDAPEDAKCPTPLCSTAACEPMSRQAKAIAELLKAYDEACAEGRTDEAEKFARAALTIDPTCFRRKR